ncbi:MULTISPECIES: hypothetical protein [unclassified Pseudoalteromonas]|uniref:hypothetical protein n=1 Tax=unclassified Pseudoalteromonas TaxID=194690 RepID=UPI0015FB3717|nr:MULTISPECIES: hypothetical protein [unclassified Pseudoalteromonas]MBB1291007.1 hypothetical protein [Pseudoalteromonas sp. SR41-5]MBB1415291.1 hypothetical protein [Pseudoalteromonas sp. SG43-8]
MIVIFKNKNGTFTVRPAFIGFIKNNYVRRTLCTIVYPLVILFTLALNFLQSLLVSAFVIIRGFYYPLVRLRPIWKTEIWQRPRTKADKNNRME